ncbi:cytochrome c oxidase assembly protein COX11, mitochondrial [Microtus ochrogaster]|uniref:Cytochrome c oxidase assembly protein COX11, mitochondrial n=1 Tax=Microtus ochrogaster TaxID=79684 RepID=A0A8J6KXZ9_MICOH|nr:cytochrome c oxidase assembly protein COX11, mitochondrial [Microtus ochrogaster]KAH0513414.1 Cytochrome c oxidase assembly protein COX11, mitochondrial [Microtus ochrogaster]
MGGFWWPGWRSVALCGRCWSQPGWAGWTVAKSEPVLRPGWKGLGGAGRGLRQLGTWERPSGVRRLAVQQPPRRPRSSNPYQRAQEDEWRRRNKTVLTYVAAAAVGMLGASYAAVPLYRLYCQTTGLGGSAVAGHSSDQIENMVPVKDRIIKVTFNADVHASLQWNFRPQQTEIYVVPGETALAFYKAKNPTDKPVIGISTYNVVPFEAGQYFNKIQCFCFEEQRLNPQEEVDMPVFFYIDPEFAEDPRMVNVDLITLSYTFFEAKEGHKLPVPGYN